MIMNKDSPDENGLAIDAQTVLNYIRERAELDNPKLLIYGQSLGGWSSGYKIGCRKSERG